MFDTAGLQEPMRLSATEDSEDSGTCVRVCVCAWRRGGCVKVVSGQR